MTHCSSNLYSWITSVCIDDEFERRLRIGKDKQANVKTHGISATTPWISIIGTMQLPSSRNSKSTVRVSYRGLWGAQVWKAMATKRIMKEHQEMICFTGRHILWGLLTALLAREFSEQISRCLQATRSSLLKLLSRWRFIIQTLTPTETCLEILKEKWFPALTISQILSSISNLLSVPNIGEPLAPEIAQIYNNDRRRYEETTKLWNIL